MFLTGPMKVMDWYKGQLLQFGLFIIFTITSAGIIVAITDRKQIKDCVGEWNA